MRHLVNAIVLACSLNAITAVTAESELAPIKPESAQPKVFREIVNRLATKHYRIKQVDDALSSDYLAAYIETLDPLKRYFLSSDIQEFNQWQYKLDDLAKRGDVTVGFYIFNRLRERATARLQHNIDTLNNQEFRFDFETDRTITLDAEKRLWFNTAAEADAFWIDSLQDSMIRLMLSDKDQMEARELLIKRYQTQLTQYQQRNSEDVFELYSNALASLYDPHTAYFSPRTTENFQINMSLSLEGIGAELTTKDEYTEVVRLIPGGPADLQGILKPEDKIVGVGQDDQEIIDVVGWRIDDVVELIRGEKGSVVRLQISTNADTPKIVSIVRDRVKLEDKSAQSQVLEIESTDNNYKLGIIEIPTFYMDFEAYRKRDPNFKSSSRDVYKLLQDLQAQQVDGIVLDLRNNGGGSLFEATALTDLFIDYGPVVQIRNADQRIYRNHRASSKAVYSGPLLVLINRLSASASEIFAGAMQDYGRALVVGSQSYGKGTVQDVTQLSAGQLKLTISKFYRVSGDSTQHMGVVPDIAFPSLYNIEKIGESQKDHALLWDQIHRVPHQQSNQLQALIQPLLAKHQQRAYQEPHFAQMVDQLHLTQTWQDEQTLSLNLQQRETRSEDRDNQLLALENKRRRQQQLPPYPSVEAWEEERDNREAEDKEDLITAESDPMLYEAAQILADQINLSAAPKPTPKPTVASNTFQKGVM